MKFLLFKLGRNTREKCLKRIKPYYSWREYPVRPSRENAHKHQNEVTTRDSKLGKGETAAKGSQYSRNTKIRSQMYNYMIIKPRIWNEKLVTSNIACTKIELAVKR